MYFAYLRSVSLARDTRRLDRRIALTVRRLARTQLRRELGAQYRMPNGATVGTHTTVYSPEYTREVYDPNNPLGYIVVRDVYGRHEEWQNGDRWGERQDWLVGFRVHTMINGEAQWRFTVVLGTLGYPGYHEVDDPGYDTVPIDRYGRNVDRRSGDESEALDLDSQLETDPNLND